MEDVTLIEVINLNMQIKRGDMMNKEKINQQSIFIPVLNSNTLVCHETGEIKYLTVLVDDVFKNYDDYIVK